MMYIPMNQTSGSTVYAYGHYPDGTAYNSPSIVTTNGRNGMAFNGVNQYVNFGYVRHRCIANLDLCPYGLTWALWVKPGGTSDIDAYIISSGAMSNEGAGMSMRTYDTKLYIWVSKPSHRYYCNYNLYNGYNQWYHLAITWTDDLGMVVYMDGVKRVCMKNM